MKSSMKDNGNDDGHDDGGIDNYCDDDDGANDDPEDEDDVGCGDGFLVNYIWQLYEGPLPAKTFKVFCSASSRGGKVQNFQNICIGCRDNFKCKVFAFSPLTFSKDSQLVRKE